MLASIDLILVVLPGGGGADRPLNGREEVGGDVLPAAAPPIAPGAPIFAEGRGRGGGGAELLWRDGIEAALACGRMRPPLALPLSGEKAPLPSLPLVLPIGPAGGGDDALLATGEGGEGTRTA